MRHRVRGSKGVRPPLGPKQVHSRADRVGDKQAVNFIEVSPRKVSLPASHEQGSAPGGVMRYDALGHESEPGSRRKGVHTEKKRDGGAVEHSVRGLDEVQRRSTDCPGVRDCGVDVDAPEHSSKPMGGEEGPQVFRRNALLPGLRSEERSSLVDELVHSHH